MEPIKDITQLDPNKDYEMTATGWVEKKDPGKEKWYRIPEAAKELRITAGAVRSAITRGSLIAKEIPGRSPTGYIRMISESDLLAYLENPKMVRDPKKRSEYNAVQYSRIKESRKKMKENAPAVEKKDKAPSAIISIPTDEIKSLKNITSEMQKLMDYCYKLGFEDGKLSVENDSSDEYRKGYEQGKKEAKEELLAALKVM